MKIKTELKVGIAGVLALILLYVGINFLKGKDIFNTENHYYAIFDNVQGLYKSNYIYLNGMKVGYIKSVENMDSQAKKFLVCIAIKSDIEIPVDSKIITFSSGLLGGNALKINMGSSNKYFLSKDTIKTMKEDGLMDQIGEGLVPAVGNLTSMISSLDTLLISVNNILDKKSQENIKTSLESIKNSTANIENITLQVDGLVESEKKKIKNILANAENITNNFKENNDKLNNIIANFSQISDTLAQAKIGSTLRETSSSMSSLSKVLERIEKGEGNAGLLIKDDKLYQNLDSSAKKLDELIEDIKKNPKRYLKFSVF